MNSAINGCNCKRNWRSYNFSQGRPRSQAVRDHRVQQSVLVKQAELIPAPRILSSDLPSQISRPHGIPTVRPRSCSAVGRGSEAYAFDPLPHHAVYYTRSMPFTTPPGCRRVNLQLSTLITTCILGHPLLRFALPGRLPIASIGVPVAAVDCGVVVVTFVPFTIGARRQSHVAERT